jgi:luciferase family oxidoreductase group 1
MPYDLSLLDKSPLLDGQTGVQALQRSVELAKSAEGWGYRRIWLAEHHGMPGLASSAPEILTAFILANTSRIRVGTGGVLLQHYSPYKVAEIFSVLASLAPERVDLGIGKAPGGFPLSTRALQWAHKPDGKPDFAEQLRLLDAYLTAQPDTSSEPAAVVTPVPPQIPERFVLGASPDSAAVAAHQGWAFVFAGQLNGDLHQIERSFDAYARAGGAGVPLLAVAAYVAGTQAEAEAEVADLSVVRLELGNGQSVNLSSEEHAAEFARQAGVSDYRTERRKPSVIAGTADSVRRELDGLHRRFGVGEFIIDTPVAATKQRLASLALLAGEVLALAA